MTRLYAELADWFHLLTDPAGYEEEARIFTQAILDHRTDVKTVLELGAGGGNNASHMKRRFEMTLTDLSPQMLELSRGINPECEHIVGDMRSLRTGRTFDAVFVHDAVAYMTSEPDLEAAMRTAHEHLEAGGLVVFVPDDTLETYRPDTDCGGHDADGRSMRYLQWMHPAEGTTHRVTFVYVLNDHGEERVETEHHVVGVFPRETWLSLLEGVGFEATTLPYRHSSFAPDAGHELFLGTKR